jgi:hypothetical protein
MLKYCITAEDCDVTNEYRLAFQTITCCEFIDKNFKRALFLLLVYMRHDKLKEKLLILKMSRVI